ncbi:DUF998 domain-containing protein [Rhodopirellula sp. MGV]|uniref:DUF998 domain-containing protein n=1 Tax=Rhodopirellula sp. MGV TaxID=2023130 RepID=UPI001304325C|nr:DUF998 domain-containing protein [Rhodopirellula sp. MGV]
MDRAPAIEPSAYALMAVLVIASGMVAAACGYEGGYSCFNHFVSELGNHHKTSAAWAYNTGLVIGGLLIALVVAGLERVSFPALTLLLGASGGTVLLGFVPESSILVMHFVLAALTFVFVGGGVILLGIQVWRDDTWPNRLWLISVSLLTVGIAICFLFAPKDKLVSLLNGNAVERPGHWKLAELEWCFVACIAIWTLTLASTSPSCPSQSSTTDRQDR